LIGVGSVLKIPANEKVAVILTLGTPAEDESIALPFPKFRFPSSELFSFVDQKDDLMPSPITHSSSSQAKK
jgi:hypothetical protein